MSRPDAARRVETLRRAADLAEKQAPECTGGMHDFLVTQVARYRESADAYENGTEAALVMLHSARYIEAALTLADEGLDDLADHPWVAALTGRRRN